MHQGEKATGIPRPALVLLALLLAAPSAPAEGAKETRDAIECKACSFVVDELDEV
jgi:hypothetical protein